MPVASVRRLSRGKRDRSGAGRIPPPACVWTRTRKQFAAVVAAASGVRCVFVPQMASGMGIAHGAKVFPRSPECK